MRLVDARSVDYSDAMTLVEQLISILLPDDAGPREAVPGGDDAITMCQVPRARDEVADDICAAAEDIDASIEEEMSPSGNAIRLRIEHASGRLSIRLTGDDARAAVIITVE